MIKDLELSFMLPTKKLNKPDDCEFEEILFFGDELDKHLTILINAIGSCKPTSIQGNIIRTRKTT